MVLEEEPKGIGMEESLEVTKLMQGDIYAFDEKAVATFKGRDVAGLDESSGSKDSEK